MIHREGDRGAGSGGVQSGTNKRTSGGRGVGNDKILTQTQTQLVFVVVVVVDTGGRGMMKCSRNA